MNTTEPEDSSLLTDVSSERLQSYEEHGYVRFEATVSEHLLDELRAIVETKLANQHQTFTLLSKRRALSVYDVPVARAILAEFCTRNRDLLVEIVGAGALIADLAVLISEAGSDAQVLHSDSQCVVGEECNILFPLEPLTALNGPTEFVPGTQWGKRREQFADSLLESAIRQRSDYVAWTLKSRRNFLLAMRKRGRKNTIVNLIKYPVAQALRQAQLKLNRRRGKAREFADTDIEQFIANKGDALLYSASLIHRGGANKSAHDRLVFGVLIKEHRNNRMSHVEYDAESHDDFYTANMKDCGKLRDYFAHG